MNKLLLRNIIIYGGTNALKSLVPLLMLPILTKHLSLVDFGILSLVETTILFLTPFVLLNIHGAINVEYFKVEHDTLKKYITNAFMLSFISSVIIFSCVFLLKDVLAKFLDINEHLVLLIVLFSVLRVVSSVVLGLYQSREEPMKFAFFVLAQTILDFSLSYMFIVMYDLGYIGRLEGMYIAYFIFSIIGIFVLYKMGYLSKINFNHSKEILSFGLPLIPHAIGGTIMAMSDRYFISYFIGNDYVGLYTIAYQISSLMLLVSVSINQAWTPMMFKLLKNKNIKQVYKITIYLFILYIVIALLIFLFKDILFSIFVDEKFYMAKKYFTWLLIGFLFQSFYFLVTNLLFFEKQTKLLASITVLCAMANIILNYFFIQYFGVIGVAYATSITWLFYFISVLFINITIVKKFYL